MTMDAVKMREFGARYAAAWSSQDPARVAEFFSPQGTLRVNQAAPAVGTEAIRAVALSFMTAFPDMQVLMDDLVVRGEGADFHWTLIGTNTGPGGTGKRIRISGYEEWQFGADGLVARSLGHFDEAEYQRQLEHGCGE